MIRDNLLIRESSHIFFIKFSDSNLHKLNVTWLQHKFWKILKTSDSYWVKWRSNWLTKHLEKFTFWFSRFISIWRITLVTLFLCKVLEKIIRQNLEKKNRINKSPNSDKTVKISNVVIFENVFRCVWCDNGFSIFRSPRFCEILFYHGIFESGSSFKVGLWATRARKIFHVFLNCESFSRWFNHLLI